MRHLRHIGLVLTLLAGLAAGAARAQDFTTSTILAGSGEVPPNASPGTGTATLTYTSALSRIAYTVTFTGLTGPATAAHIHLGAAGMNGPVILPFTNLGPPNTTSGTFSGFLTSSDVTNSGLTGIFTIADAANAIRAGNTYIDIHTSSFPSGEIRGQIPAPALSSVPEPSSLAAFGMMGLAVAGLRLRKRTSGAAPQGPEAVKGEDR